MEPTNIIQNPLDTTEPKVLMRPEASVQVPMRPADQMQTTPQPSAASQTPAQQPAPTNVVPAVHKKGLFDRVLEGMAGGPTRIQDPETGAMSEVPMTKRSLTSHILAGAITGIIQGAQAPYVPSENPAGTRSGQNMRALGAAAQATQGKLAEIRNQPQAQLDDQKLRQYNTMKRNIDLHGAMMTLGNAKQETQERAEAPGKVMWKTLQDMAETDSSLSDVFLENSPQPASTLLKKYPNMSKNNFLMVGHQAMLNSDGSENINPDTGKPYMEPLFLPIKVGATIPMTEALKNSLSENEPKVLKIPNNTPISLDWAINQYTSHINMAATEDALNGAFQQIQSVTGIKDKKDFGKILRSDPILRKNVALIGRYLGHGNTIDDGLAALSKDKDADPQLVPRLAQALGMNEVDSKTGQTVATKLGLARKDELAKQKTDEEVAKRKEDAKVQRELHKQELADAQDIKTKGLESATNASQPFPNNWKDPKTGQNYDVSHPSVKLVEGTFSPSELSKRATKGSDAYNSVIKQADDYSMAKYGKPFDFEKADRDFTYANQRMTKDTLNLIQSLTGEGAENVGGTLAQLQRQYAALNNKDFDSYNAAVQWVSKHIGEPGVPQFQTTLFGVGDEMAKILGGGTATVEGFKQAQNVLDKVFSQRASEAAISSVRGNMANRANGMIRDNRYLTKDYGKMRNPLEPNDIPSINGVTPVKKRVVNGNTFFMLPTGVVVDRRGRTVDLNNLPK